MALARVKGRSTKIDCDNPAFPAHPSEELLGKLLRGVEGAQGIDCVDFLSGAPTPVGQRNIRQM
ncbi:hypothetical protein BO70DRAFT_364845 [Aspergillus heteromorphus CBS 117.55]|uniref:Uncharacterized protein n=1 Tax=Aspergillus heteromorphus CBS 117.55 TaxID=1448321 RepID=A0A317VHD3_9EURO|nr:uncharacterized protein BO70DRAFT_364845 [Aspergillus heteromorphus CBS 117.55]PWY72312.1 hypothetical protein BO70DRAFT_364845 [Aspergillus heteromorphus CBS 117.55]